MRHGAVANRRRARCWLWVRFGLACDWCVPRRGRDAEEIQRQHPHLTLAQIYAALTYYHDHRQHFDSEIRYQLKDVDLIASRQEPSPVRAKLRTAGESP